MGYFRMGRTRVLHAMVWILKKTLRSRGGCSQDLREGRRQSWPLEVTVGFIKYAERRRKEWG